MSEVKRCTQCGLLKDVNEFRKYKYAADKGTEGRYRTCKSCEAINASYNRLKKKLESFRDPNTKELCYSASTKFDFYETTEALERIEGMYALLEGQGLRVPQFGTKRKDMPEASALEAVDKLSSFYGSIRAEVTPHIELPTADVPDELQRWLDADMQDWIDAELSPEYLQETIYESLKAKYRPQISVNKETFMPVYDDTYKTVLNNILRRFDDYEEMMATQEVEEAESSAGE